MHMTTVSSKYQICIPKPIREEMDIKAGQKFIIIPKGTVLNLVPKRSINDVKGLLAGANTNNIRDREDRF